MMTAGIPFLRKYPYVMGKPAAPEMPPVIILADAPMRDPFPPNAAPTDRQ
jgi:hypothetical protein